MREIVEACLQKSFGFKLAHELILWVFGDTLGSLWRKHEGPDNVPGTYVHWLRHGTMLESGWDSAHNLWSYFGCSHATIRICCIWSAEKYCQWPVFNQHASSLILFHLRGLGTDRLSGWGLELQWL